MRDVTELVTRARSGDREALAALVEAVQDDIWRFQLSRHRSEADAEDATQETFVRMMSSLGELREPGAFRGWLYRIALNEALETGRRRAAGAKALAASASMGTREEETVDRSELRQAVRRAVGGLEDKLRTTVELRYEHGLAYADIAQAMDCPEGTVATRLRRAHERLKQVLAGAGVLVALAAIESELSAAPRVQAPPRLAGRLSKLARENRLGEPPVAAGPRPRTVVAGFALTAILAAIVAWRFGFGSKPEAGGSASPSGTVARAPAPPSGEAGAAAGETAKPAAPAPIPPEAASARLRVRVLRRDGGEPVAGAAVTLDRGGERPGTRPAVTGTTDAHGEWVADVEAGPWGISARAPGFVGTRTDCLVRANRANLDVGEDEEPPDPVPIYDEFRVTATAGMETARDIRLSPAGSLTCRVVTPSGLPLAGVAVKRGAQTLVIRECRFSFDDEHYLPYEFLTDSEGRFTVEGFVPEGTLRLSLHRPGLATRELDLNLAATGEQTLQMNEARSLDGIVTDPFGRPLAGVRFLFRPDLSAADTSLKALPGTTDEVGRYAFDAGEAGVQMLVAWAPGHVPTIVDLTKAPPGRLNITLPVAEEKVRGRVLSGKAGVPLAGARVTLSRMEFAGTEGDVELVFHGQGAWWVPREGIRGYAVLSETEAPPSVLTAEDGTFTLEGVPPGASVGVTHEEHGAQEFVVPASGTLEVRLGKLGGD